jgi:hypothetical protein
MFCPKCGQQNPETGKFCRNCGTDLGNVATALTAGIPEQAARIRRRRRSASLESAVTRIFTGLAFLAVACVLGITNAAGGRFWWFWLLIPAFGSIGRGVAQYLQLKRLEKGLPVYAPAEGPPSLQPAVGTALPPGQTPSVSAESRYKTGDLVPPSVTDNTTRHLEMDSEKKTMALPKD